ncbi:MAG: 2,3-diphosphoglycerate synthetase [Actinobacteria bacterium]|nr:2,3-diphosphoglycerate synthetase [Actinomycetota bacterium]
MKDFNFDFEIFHSEYGYLESIKKAVEKVKPDVVFDLSDEPVLGYEERMIIASLLSYLEVDYVGSDFNFKAPRFLKDFSVNTVAVIGTGKRVGKTAVSAAFARFLKSRGKKVVVLAMGRGGPEEPVVLDGENILVDNRFLLELKKAGKHAASDYVEDAMMSRITTVGCRRCGGGFAGVPFTSNVIKGFQVAKSLSPDIIVLEGSGSSIPPIKAQRYLTVSNLLDSKYHVIGYLGPYRLLLSRLLVLTNCEGPAERKKFEEISKMAKKINPEIEIVGIVFRPRPLEPLKGDKVFLATTAGNEYLKYIARHLEETEGCQVVYSSGNLARRDALRQELEIKKREFNTVVMELKAAAVDVALDFAVKNEKRAVFIDNIPHVVTSDLSIDKYFENLVRC